MRTTTDLQIPVPDMTDQDPMAYCLECPWCNTAFRAMTDSAEPTALARRCDGEIAAEGLDCWCGHDQDECRMFDPDEHDWDCPSCTGLDEDHWRVR